jgi:putative membrane protein
VVAPLLVVAFRHRPSWFQAPAPALAAGALELVVVWGWHLPWLHAAARESLAVFAAEQASFLAAGYAVWAGALAAPGGRTPASSLIGVGVLLMTSMHMTLLGALLTLAPEPWYHGAGAAHGLGDQQLGGAVMLVIGGIAYLAGGLTVLARAFREPVAWRKSS